MSSKTITTLLLLIFGIIICLGLIGYLIKNPDAKNTNENEVSTGPLPDVATTNININQNNIMSENQSTTTPTQATIKTNLGDITVKLYSEDAPKTVANFVKLARAGFYDGIKFHRIIRDFMIQTGDPLTKDDTLKNRWGSGDPGYKFDDEINNHKLVEGSLAMANSGPNTNGSQFFIVTTAETPWLDGKHTNFGEVISGLDIVNLIENAKTAELDRPINDIVINAIELQ